MSVVFVFQISEAISALRRETYHHPKLRTEIINAMQAGVTAHTKIFTEEDTSNIVMIRNLEEFVGFIAAKLDIALHGLYSQEDIDKLCHMMRKKLEDQRKVEVGLAKITGTIVDTTGKHIIH